jgi:hypothetical protein
MLIGAAVGATAGGAGAAIQGGDPLKGALTGGAMGAVGGGIGGAMAPAAEVANAGISSTAVAAGGSGGGGAFVPAAGSGASFAVPAAGTTSAIGGGTGAGADIFAGYSPTGSNAAYNATQMGANISGAGTGGGTALTTPPPQPNSQSMLNRVPTPSVDNSQNSAKNIFGYTPGQEGYLSNTQLGITAGTAGLGGLMQAERDQYGMPPSEEYDGPLNKLRYDPNKFTASSPTYAPSSVYRPTYAAEGGIMKLAQGGMPGPVERMSANALGGDANMYPQSQQQRTYFATPTQMPASAEVTMNNQYKGVTMARGGVARFDGGGLGSLAMGMPSSGADAGVQSMADQGIAALGQAGKKRMLTQEQMDAIRLQGMSKAGLKDVYGQMAEQGLAKGGTAGNKDMAAIDAYVAAAQGGDRASVAAKAQAGDYNAMLALNKIRNTPNQNYAGGGHLGGYSDGGRMLKGPGDGMSDNIPASIAGKQPARLADGEFVVPADVVSHLGNGSTDAGAKQLYAMMNRVRKARTGNPKQGKQIKPAKYMAA